MVVVKVDEAASRILVRSSAQMVGSIECRSDLPEDAEGIGGRRESCTTCSFLDVLKSARAFSRTLPLDLFMNLLIPDLASAPAPPGAASPLMAAPSGGVMSTIRYSGSFGPDFVDVLELVGVFLPKPGQWWEGFLIEQVVWPSGRNPSQWTFLRTMRASVVPAVGDVTALSPASSGRTKDC